MLSYERCRAKKLFAAFDVDVAHYGRKGVLRVQGLQSVGLVGDPHALDGAGGRIGGKHPGGSPDLVRGNPGDVLHLFRRVFTSSFGQFLEAMTPVLDELLVVEFFFYDYLHHG